MSYCSLINSKPVNLYTGQVPFLMKKVALLRQRGISLVESLAALVILSLGAVIALTWFVNSADRVARLRQEEAILLAQLQAVDYLGAVNFLKQPQGQTSLAEFELRWRSLPVAPTQRSVNKLGSDGRFEVGLLEVQAQLWRRGETEPTWVVEGAVDRRNGSERRGRIPASGDPAAFSLQVATYRDLGDGGAGRLLGLTR
jgi:prepilin-type N-terminal cleavage/methylation domain-containing protein